MEIGDPVAAMDVDADDTLTYRLDAAGDMSFDIDPATGQLMTECSAGLRDWHAQPQRSPSRRRTLPASMTR